MVPESCSACVNGKKNHFFGEKFGMREIMYYLCAKLEFINIKKTEK